MQQSPFGRYTILRELGRGAIGKVYAARDASSGAVVALKVLEPALFSEPCSTLADLFLKNARSTARLRHRNIVKVHDAGEAGGTAFVATELLEGESLRNLLDAQPLPLARAIQIFDDIASALAYAHEEGMVHRGVKPSNIIVLPSGLAKLGDFGTGQIGEAALRYKSPEQARGDPVDHRSDIFSLGAVFYEMLTRRSPFAGNSAKEITQNILRAQPRRPSEVSPHVPGALDGIVSSMLAGKPDERLANARLLLRDLQRVEEALGLGPGASASRERQVPDETRLAPRVQKEPVAAQPAPEVPAARVPPGEAVPTLRTAVTSPRVKTDPTPPPPETELRFAAFDEQDTRFIMDRETRRQRSSGSRSGSFAALVLMLAAVPIGIGAFWYYSPQLSELLMPASRVQQPQQLPTAAVPTSSPAPLPVAEVIKEPAAAPAQEAPRAVPPTSITPEPSETKQVATAAAAPAQKASRAVPPTASTPEPQPGATAKLILAVSPQGELYVDGKHHGTTPPLTTLDLEPGMHHIEIRSASRKPYVTYMTVQAGEERRIRHEFGAKPSGPPR